MKDIVPEFVSRNSEFEKYDKESVSCKEAKVSGF